MKYLVFCLLAVLVVFCKSEKRDVKSDREYLNYDYFNHNYLYLTEDYSINIPSEMFDSKLNELKIPSCRINTYYDSLLVVMKLEFEDKHYARCGALRMGYSWERLAYHLWLTVDESKEFARRFDISHPYLFKKFIIDSQNPEIDMFLDNLKNKIVVEYPDVKFVDLTRTKFLDQSMRLNPNRIKDLQDIKKRTEPKNVGEGCGKPNCCQN